MRLDDADGEAEAEARALPDPFRREERVEDLPEVLGPDAGPVVLHHDRDPTVVAGRADGENAVPSRGLHGVDRVAEEVEEHLLKLVGVGPDLRERIEIGHHADPAEVELGRLELERGAHDLVEVDPPPLGRLAPCEDEKLANDLCRALAFPLDHVDPCPHGVGQGVLALEELHRELDRGQRIIELVGHPGQECAECLQLVGLDQLPLRLLQLTQVGLELRIEPDLFQRERGFVGEAREDAALFVAEAVRGAVVGREDTDRLIADAEGHDDARPDVVGDEVGRDREAALAGQILDLDGGLMQEGIAREGIGGRGDRDRAHRARPPAEARLQAEAVRDRVEQEKPHAVGAEQFPGDAHHVPLNGLLAIGREEPLGEFVERLVVAGLEGEPVEGSPVLDRRGGLGAERRE